MSPAVLVQALVHCLALRLVTSSEGAEETEEEEKKDTGYRTSSKIEKRPTEDHPCNLTRTTVKISFPDLRNELFVNILGYKEPNLIHLWRCKGVCGEQAGSAVVCGPTQVKNKKVKMMFKTNSSGQSYKDSKTRLKEMILDEHVECGCQCRHITASQCVGKFNEVNCECECDEASFGEERKRCEGRSITYWDTRSCQCKSKSIAPRGLDPPCAWDPDVFVPPESSVQVAVQRGLDSLSYVFLGCFLTIAICLSVSTAYYRRKLKRLEAHKKGKRTEEERESKRRQESSHRESRSKEGRDGKSRSVEGKKKTPTWRLPPVPRLEKCHEGERGGKRREGDQELIISDNLLLNQVVERYDSHGVRIPDPGEDEELFMQFTG